MMSASLLQLVQGFVKGQPLRNAQSQLTFFFHLLEGEEVFPLRVVLGGGDAPLSSIGQGQFSGAAALGGAGWRDFRVDCSLCGFAHDASGIALVVAIDFASVRVRSLGANASGFQRSGVGNGNVAVYARE